MTAELKAFSADVDAAADGTFEAIVSVFGNGDVAGDIVMPGAFTASLAKWRSMGDPIPVIFAHRWDDLDAHLGVVERAEERPAGLWVKARLDLDDLTAAKVHRLMRRRSLREFSFAYDVVRDRRNAAGHRELHELDLFEIGPCLKGVNPATELLAAKRRHHRRTMSTSTAKTLIAIAEAHMPGSHTSAVRDDLRHLRARIGR